MDASPDKKPRKPVSAPALPGPLHCPPSWAPGQTHLLQLTRCLFLLLVLQTEGADGEATGEGRGETKLQEPHERESQVTPAPRPEPPGVTTLLTPGSRAGVAFYALS